MLAGGEVIPMEKTEFYLNDLLGLKTLDENKKIIRVYIDDMHVRYSEEDLNRIFIPFLRL